TYPIVPVLSDPDGKLANYSLTAANGTLTVKPAPLAITADDVGRVYGAPNPSLAVSYSGFVLGQGPSALSGAVACATTATPGSPVGTYPISCSGQSSDNYALTYHPGTLTVSRATPTIVWSDPAPLLYGSPLGAQQLNASAVFSLTGRRHRSRARSPTRPVSARSCRP